jgi:hypothetical protein
MGYKVLSSEYITEKSEPKTKVTAIFEYGKYSETQEYQFDGHLTADECIAKLDAVQAHYEAQVAVEPVVVDVLGLVTPQE